jgi:hypothetical protein
LKIHKEGYRLDGRGDRITWAGHIMLITILELRRGTDPQPLTTRVTNVPLFNRILMRKEYDITIECFPWKIAQGLILPHHPRLLNQNPIINPVVPVVPRQTPAPRQW